MDLQQRNLLIVEDAKDWQMMIRAALGPTGRHVYVSTIDEAKSALKKSQFDLILLDINLPDGSGLEFCAEISNSSLSTAPVILLSAVDETVARVTGLTVGAMDYITKPFQAMELVARIKNKIQLFEKLTGTVHTRKIGNAVIDAARLKVIFDSGRSVDLSALESKLLAFLTKNVEVVSSRDAILDQVWGGERNVTDRSVDAAISALRKKLSEWNFEIKSVYGAGYSVSVRDLEIIPPEVKTEFLSQIDSQWQGVQNAIEKKEWKTAARTYHKMIGSILIFRSSSAYKLRAIEADLAGGEIESEALSLIETEIRLAKKRAA